MGDSPIHQAAKAISERLDEAGIEHAVAGAIALGAHGVVRATEDVDLLITREGLARFKKEWLGRGYVDLRPGGKAVRDTRNDVKIDFLITGDFPGDGQPKPIAFPEPSATVGDGDAPYPVVSLLRLLELKLASGMTAAHRLQDLADVLRLIEVRQLPRETADELNPYVREKFLELWQVAQHPADDY